MAALIGSYYLQVFKPFLLLIILPTTVILLSAKYHVSTILISREFLFHPRPGPFSVVSFFVGSLSLRNTALFTGAIALKSMPAYHCG